MAAMLIELDVDPQVRAEQASIESKDQPRVSASNISIKTAPVALVVEGAPSVGASLIAGVLLIGAGIRLVTTEPGRQKVIAPQPQIPGNFRDGSRDPASADIDGP